jgi:hypothetical protein
MTQLVCPYRGSKKHKNRPAEGRKGTICPEWTHLTSSGNLGNDPFDHRWSQTRAAELFDASVYDPEGSGKRYATSRGIAFVAQATGDGSWHGYPEPWNKVPVELVNKWRSERVVSAADLRRFADFPKGAIAWALDSDDE